MFKVFFTRQFQLTFYSLLALGMAIPRACGCDCVLFHAEGFSVVLPKGVAAKPQGPKPDFSVLVFEVKERKLLGVYGGNAPSFPSENVPKDVKIAESRIHGLNAQTVQWKSKAGNRFRETLVQLREEGWPTYAHFGYSNLSKKQAALADKVILSVQAKDMEPKETVKK